MAIFIRNSFFIIASSALFAVSFTQPVDNASTDGNITAEIVKEVSPIDMVSDNSRNTRTDTIDGVLFTISTDKKYYSSGDSVRVRYRMKNGSMGTVLYDFNTACPFDLQFVDSRGATVYSLLASRACLPDSSHILLSPSAEKTESFAPVPLNLKKEDSLTVKAQMAGYPLSTVQVKVRWESAATVPPVVALEGRAGHKPVLEFNHETKMLIIRVDRAQRLTISAFILTGQKVNKLSCEKFLAPGTHLISFNNKKLADGVVVFKVEGNGFSESKTINLSR